jgi:hypothetical protein
MHVPWSYAENAAGPGQVGVSQLNITQIVGSTKNLGSSGLNAGL